MKIAIWFMVAIIACAAIAGAVYLGVHERERGDRGNQDDRPGREDQIKNLDVSSGKQSFELEVDGTQREFVVYRPENISESKEVPVVFMYHGSGGGGEQMYRETGWKAKADEEGFMVVYPTALKYHLYSDEKVIDGEVQTNVSQYQTKWNIYELPGLLDENYSPQTLHDDVEFTRAMVDFVSDNYAVDGDRFYASGFSNGGQFVSRLAIEATDIFAAFSTASSIVPPDPILAKVEEASEKPEYRPVMQVVGENDPRLTYNSDTEAFTVDESAAEDGNPIKENFIDPYLALEDLSDEYTYEKVGGAAHFTYDQSLVGADNEYQLYVVGGMSHIYPNGKNFRVDAADIFWSFFEVYSL